MKIKNPNDPATEPQKYTIESLRANLNITASDLSMLTKGEASALIDQLLDMKKAAKAAKAAPAPMVPGSLMAMAAALEGGPALTEDPGNAAEAALVEFETQTFTNVAPAHGFDPQATQHVMLLSVEQAKTALSWLGVVEGETDLTPEDQALELVVRAFLDKVEAKPVAAFTPTATEPVPAGHYAIGAEGETKFYRVQYGKAGGKWEGFLFLDAQASDDYHKVRNAAAKATIIQEIQEQGIMESMARYGHELGKCGASGCGLTLTDPQSLADGIGPICKKKLGF